MSARNFWMQNHGWKHVKKGAAHIWSHPNLDRAIVQNYKGVFYDGEWYVDIESAAKSAMGREGGER